MLSVFLRSSAGLGRKVPIVSCSGRRERAAGPSPELANDGWEPWRWGAEGAGQPHKPGPTSVCCLFHLFKVTRLWEVSGSCNLSELLAPSPAPTEEMMTDGGKF